MKTKTIFITGVEGTGSGSWDWYPNKIDADASHENNIKVFSKIKGETIYRGDLEVPKHLSQSEITNYIEVYLHEHEFELSPLNNKIILPIL